MNALVMAAPMPEIDPIKANISHHSAPSAIVL